MRIAKEAVLEEEKQDALRTRREAQEATMERYEKEDDSLFADVYDITKKFPDVDTGMEFKIRGCRLIPQHGFGLWEEGEQPRWAAFMPPEEGKSFKMGLLLDRKGMHFYNRELDSAFSIAHGSVVDWVANPHSFDNMSWGRTCYVC